VANIPGTATYLRERAAAFRKMAEEHIKVGSLQISAKMTEVAADFEAQAAAIDKSARTA
jgi:hypothetical protein